MKIKSILYLGICAVFFWACGKDDNGPEPQPEPNPVQQPEPEPEPEPEQQKDTVVYVAGVQLNGYGKAVATLWTNKVPQTLSDDFSNNIAQGLEIIGKDRYLIGYGQSPNRSNVAKLWKNGEETTLFDEDDDSYATAICSYEGVPYVAASYGGDGIIKAWTQDADKDITDGTFYSFAYDIAVDEAGHPYIVGYVAKPHQIATLWQNGTQVELTDGNFNARARTIFLADGDVYAGGYEDNSTGFSVAKIWKNGRAVALGDGTQDSYVYSLFVSEKEVYAAGMVYLDSDSAKATIWKNGIPMALETAGYKKSVISKIKVVGNTVYACGYLESEYGDELKAVVWKNGTLLILDSPFPKSLASDLEIVIE
ncbi:hypothetical protein ACNR9Q_12330 [Maribacter sp. X9]|uniref:hypothetical protein n=1 Tax=Maribacter sp. X9 TaxID=3402159 RepID=UPI003AF3C544